MIVDRIDADSVDPTAERAAELKTVEVPENTNEDFLAHVFAIGGGDAEQTDEP